LKRFLRFGWLLLCLLALAGWWFGWGFVDGAGQRIEHRQLLDAIMGVLAFPAGLLWVWIAPNLGYIQWFWLLPYVFRLRANG
jgi:hypothetical protein